MTSSTIDDELDTLFHTVDELFRQGQFDACNDLLQTIDVEHTDLFLLIGWLSATLPAADKLPNRDDLLNKIEAMLQRTQPERVEKLLCGLRPAV